MATYGEVHGQINPRAGSDDLDNLKCQLCWEDGLVHEAVGMCIDCNDTLCENCYKGHRLSRPTRKHKLIDREQMLEGRVRANTKDTCTEKCEVHEDEVIKYYCTCHSLLGCTVCVTLGHTTCRDVHYIPQVAKELESNDDYRKTKIRLNSALDTFKKVSDNAELYSKELEASCAEVVESIREFRRSVYEALGQMEADMIEKVGSIKATQMKELAALGEKYRVTQEELQSALGKVEALQKAGQNCSVFAEMMRMKAKLTNLDAKINEAIGDTVSQKSSKVMFTPNQDTLEMIKHSTAFGDISGSDKQSKLVKFNPTQDLNVKTETDNTTCNIAGLVILHNDRLVLTDLSNSSVKEMSVQSGQVLNSLKLPAWPWDISAISNTKVAVTVPKKKTITLIAVGDDAMSIDRTIAVNGECRGIDYRNRQLAVSFINPAKIEILSLQGSVLITLSRDKYGRDLFNTPNYLSYGQDSTTLYVSNSDNNTVVCVKLDGTIVSTYADKDFKFPRQSVVASNGDVLVCAEGSNALHRITKNCNKMRVLLNHDDGLDCPRAICINEEKDTIYVAMYNNDRVKVYTVD